MCVGQPIRISFLPKFEGDAARFEDFFCRLVAEVSPPLICCSRASEQSAIPRSANPWNRLPAKPIKLNDSNSDAFSQVEKGVGTALIQAMQDDPQLAGFQNVAIGELLMRIRSSRLLPATKIDY
jgi:hypothetical protein